MSDGSTTEGTPGTESQGVTNPPPPAAPVQSAPPAASQDLDKLLTALNALPETIARSVKEAVGTPQKSTQAPTATDAGKSAPADSGKTPPAKEVTKEPGKMTFAEWWTK